jgi:hypothetical protein
MLVVPYPTVQTAYGPPVEILPLRVPSIHSKKDPCPCNCDTVASLQLCRASGPPLP